MIMIGNGVHRRRWSGRGEAGNNVNTILVHEILKNNKQ